MQINLTQMKEAVVDGWEAAIAGLQNPRKLAQGLEEMTLAKKIEIGVAVLILGGVGFFVYQNIGYWTGMQSETRITIWVENHAPGRNPAFRVSATNPADPKVKNTITGLADEQGKLELTVYMGGPKTKTKQGVNYTPSNKDFSWRDQFARAVGISNPERRMMAMIGVGIAENRLWSFPVSAHLTHEQIKAQATAAGALKDDWANLEDSVNDGSFESALHDKLFAAFDVYNTKPAKSNDQQVAAKEVLRIGRQYMSYVEDSREKAIQKYVDTVDDLLEQPQKDVLAEVAGSLAFTPAGK